MKSIAHTLIARKIKHYFGFLIDRGYRTGDIQYYPKTFGNWRVILESPNCLIILSEDRNEIRLSFASVNTDINNQIALQAMIYYLSHEQNFIGNFEESLSWGKKRQFERLANQLIEYIDRIIPYFGNDFEKYKDDLLMAQKKYNDRLLKEYMLAHHKSS